MEAAGTHQGFKVDEELKTFLVGDCAEGVVGVAANERVVERGVAVVEAVGSHVVEVTFVANNRVDRVVVVADEVMAGLSFKEHTEPLINPEVLPILASDPVSSPRVSDLMNSHKHSIIIFCDNARFG